MKPGAPDNMKYYIVFINKKKKNAYSQIQAVEYNLSSNEPCRNADMPIPHTPLKTNPIKMTTWTKDQ